MGSLGVAVPSSSLAAGNQLRVSILVGESKFSAQMVGKILPCHSCQREARPQCDPGADRKSTRLNSNHEWISYAVFCLKKKNAHKDVIDARLGESVTTGEHRAHETLRRYRRATGRGLARHLPTDSEQLAGPK